MGEASKVRKGVEAWRSMVWSEHCRWVMWTPNDVVARTVNMRRAKGFLVSSFGFQRRRPRAFVRGGSEKFREPELRGI